MAIFFLQIVDDVGGFAHDHVVVVDNGDGAAGAGYGLRLVGGVDVYFFVFEAEFGEFGADTCAVGAVFVLVEFNQQDYNEW